MIEVQAKLLKNVSHKFIKELTNLLNKILETGNVPDEWNVGRMTLIDKKEPSLEIKNKHPTWYLVYFRVCWQRC